MHGRDLLARGLIWRVGEGTKINVLHDNWIPRNGSMVPLGATYVPNTVKVADLPTPEGTTWDEKKLLQVFTPSDVQDIRQILIEGPGKEDFWAWKPDERGSFSVRSSYHMIMRLKMTRED